MPLTLPNDRVEKLISILDKREALDKELRAILSEGYSGKGTPQPPDIGGVKWFVKGGAEAGPLDPFAFCFSANQDGSVSPEKRPLVDYLKANRELKVGEYTITASKDFKFIQRKREVSKP
jgi:hypothetical protein